MLSTASPVHSAYVSPQKLGAQHMEQGSLFGPNGPMKRCVGCREFKPLDEFHRHGNKKDGRQPRCKPCNIAINKQWYRDHPEARERMDPYAKIRRTESQRRLFEYLLEHPCVDCGELDPVVLEFDHLRDKVANVSYLVASSRPWHLILDEIAKCEVVCANCHRRRTLERCGAFRIEESRRIARES
jgi:hypothetical protein